MRVTVDVSRAEKILRSVGKNFTKANRRTVAMPAAKMLQDDMRQGAGGIVPEWKGNKLKGGGYSGDGTKFKLEKYHTFSSRGREIRIRAGNLRKSMKMMTFRKSGLMWVGGKYGAAKSNDTIGETYRTADGFYDKMYIAKTGNKFHTRSLARKEGEIRRILMDKADVWIKKIIARANATP